MTSVRHAISAPVVAVVGVVAGSLLAVWAATIALTGGSITVTNLAVLLGGELAVLAAGVAVATAARGGELESLERAARALEAGDLSAELPTDRDDEVGRVATTMETLVDGLEDAERRAVRQERRAEERAAELPTLSDALTAHAEAFEAAMDRAAEGDLTARIEAEAEDERLETLASQFDATLGNIEETTDRLKRFATDVAVHGEEVTASAEEVQQASEQVSTSVQEISEATETQSLRDALDRFETDVEPDGAAAGWLPGPQSSPEPSSSPESSGDDRDADEPWSEDSGESRSDADADGSRSTPTTAARSAKTDGEPCVAEVERDAAGTPDAEERWEADDGWPGD